MDVLGRHGAGAVITDTAGRRDCAHMHLAIPNALVRFVGNSLHPSDYQRIDDWVQRIGHYIEQGMEHLWFFVHQHEERSSPELATYFVNQLNAQHGLGLRAPMVVQPTLF